MRINNIIKYRSVWMGLAIIWIVTYHSSLIISNSLLSFIKKIGYGGVDIFIFASGIGCYYSLNKNYDINEFIKRRFKKLMPTYWCFLIYFIMFKVMSSHMPISAIIGNVLCIQSFTTRGNSFNWYICAIWLFYLLAPYLYNYTNKIKSNIGFFIFVFILILFSVPFFKAFDLLMMITRLPLFFIGMYVAKSSSQKDYILSKKSIIISIILLIIGIITLKIFYLKYPYYLRNYGMYWYPYILITPGLCIVISLICYLIDNKIIGKYIVKFLNFVGSNTFELYLTHILVFMIVKYMRAKKIIELNNNKLWVIAIIVSIIAAVALKYFTKLLVYLYEKIKLGN